MGVRFSVLMAALIAVLAACSTPPAPVTSESGFAAYRVRPEQASTGAITGLRVSLTFNVDADGVVNVYMPSRYAGHEELWRNFDGIGVNGGMLAATDDPAVWRVTAVPTTRVTFSYVARSGIKHAPTAEDEQPYVPWIFDDWFFVDTVTLFARPDLPRTTPAVFGWEGDPSFTFASELETARTVADGSTLQTMRNAVLLSGRGIRTLALGSTRLALRGEFPFQDDVLLRDVARVIAVVRAHWEAPVDAPFLVAMVATPKAEGSRGSFSGANLRDAFLATISGEVELSRVLAMRFAHEVQHTWMPDVLGDARVSEGQAWFGEGFTDYYARALMLRAEVISLAEFAALWNGELAAYAASPARNFPNQRLTDEFWRDFDTGRMPYIRGAMMAARWDRLLRELSDGRHSLDDVIREQRRRATAPRESEPGPADSYEALFAAVAGEFGLDVGADMAAYIEAGLTIRLQPNAFGPCFRVETAGEGDASVQKLVPVPGAPETAAACQLG